MAGTASAAEINFVGTAAITTTEGVDPPGGGVEIESTGGDRLAFGFSGGGSPLIGYNKYWTVLEPGQKDTFWYSFNVSNLPPGEYSLTLSVDEYKWNFTYEYQCGTYPCYFWDWVTTHFIPIALKVIPPKITISPPSAVVETQVCSEPPVFYFTVSDDGNTGRTVHTATGDDWIKIFLGYTNIFFLEVGESRPLAVGFNGSNRELATYEGEIIITSKSTTVAEVPFTIKFVPERIIVSKNELYMNVKKCDTPPTSTFTVKNGGKEPIGASIASDSDWITMLHHMDRYSSYGVSLSPGQESTVAVVVDITNLDPGLHTGNIKIKSCSKETTVPVKVNVLDQKCTVIKYVTGSGQTGELCKSPTAPFVVSVENKDGSPLKKDETVNWEITYSPEGSGPSWAAEYIRPNPDGFGYLHEKKIKLGSLTGEYYAEAVCPDCTEGNPQYFKATAKCPKVEPFTQYNPNWKDEPYDNWCYVNGNKKNKRSCDRNADGTLKQGYTQFTIGDKGCATTSIAMVARRYGSTATPDVWDDFMTDSGGYSSEGDVYFTAPNAIKDGKISYVNTAEHKGYRKIVDGELKIKTVSKSLMDNYLSRCMPVIVQVFNPKTGNMHWVVVTEKSGNDYKITDPSSNSGLLSWYGDIYNLRAYEDKSGGCQ